MNPLHQRISVTRLALVFLMAVSSLMSLVSPGIASAAPNAISYKGITLTPAVVNLDLREGQDQAQCAVHVTNNTHTKQSLTVSTLDFKSLNTTGGVAFIGSEANQVAYKYGLASWLDTGEGAVELNAGETKALTITVENRGDLSAGGHYAAILFRTVGGNTSKGSNQVALNEVVSCLVFARKLSGAQYGMSLQTLAVAHNWFTLPASVNAVFRNTGNVQTTPRGLVTITGPSGSEALRGIVNPDSNLVLPDSSRLYQTALTRTGSTWWPGTYHVHLQYRYDGTTTVQTADATFFYLSPVCVLLAVVILVGLGWAVRRRRYLRRKLRHLHLGRRLKIRLRK